MSAFAQIPLVQTPEAQSLFRLQIVPMRHLAAQSEPPQSTPVSFPSLTPLKQS